MTDLPTRISDEELSDYLDGRGDLQTRLRIAAAIERNPAVAGRFRALKANDEELRLLGADVLREPVPERLRSVLQRAQQPAQDHSAVPRRPPWRFGIARIAQLAAAVAVGVAIGWWANLYYRGAPDDLLEPFIRQAALSHQLFQANQNFENLRAAPGEAKVTAIDTPFMTPVRLPESLDVGYHPVMLRSVQGSVGAGLQIAYVRDDGDWVSLMVRQHSDQDDVPVRMREEEGLSILYWLDGPLVYALVGGNEDSLRRLARDLYAAPAMGGAWRDEPSRAAAYVFD